MLNSSYLESSSQSARRQEADCEIGHKMGDQGGEEAAGPRAYDGEQETNKRSGYQPATALIKMSKREKRSGACDARDNLATGPRLEHELNETSINELFADGDGRDQREEDQAFDIVLGENFQGELRHDSLNFLGARDKSAQTEELTGKDQRGKENGHCNRKLRIRNRQAELRRADSMSVCAPENDGGREPLEGDGGGVEGEAVHLRRLGQLEQLADAAAAEPGHREAEKKQYEREIPVHHGR